MVEVTKQAEDKAQEESAKSPLSAAGPFYHSWDWAKKCQPERSR